VSNVKLKRLLPGLLLIGLLLLLLAAAWPDSAAPQQPSNSPAAPQPETNTSETNSIPYPLGPRAQAIPDSYELLAENEKFQLYANAETLAFKVLDKRSDYVWHSNLDEVTDEDDLNRTWTAFATSGISIDYLDERARSERNSITNTEHSIDFNPTDQGFEATVTFEEPSISLMVVVNLEADGVRIEVPADSVREEDPAFKLGLLYVYPFMGATKADTVPGYMFIPDGAGSLIRFAAETKAQNMFYGRYYGTDLGIIAVLPYEPTINRPYKISVPVSGMVHGEKENGYLAIVESGASYGELHAHPAGVTTQFNFLYSAFIYNQSYFQATNRAGAGVTTLQPTTNDFDVSIHYRFLTGEESDYVGMARSYQQYLVDKGVLQVIDDPDEDIGIRLEFLGGEKERVLFWFRSIPMTTVDQMSNILSQLQVENPEVIYYGWQPKGASTMPPRSLQLDGTLGTVGQLETLAEEITAGGGNFYLYLDPQAALWEEGGYSERRDLAMSITNFNLLGYNRGKVNHYFNLDALSERYRSLSEDIFAELPTAGLAIDGVTSSLYSDFKDEHLLNREDAIARYQELLAASAGSRAYYQPNDYLFAGMRAYYDMPIDNSGYLYMTEAVPFIQIVFAGYVPYYGTPLNFSSNLQQDLLRHADFGVYPSYFLSEGVTAEILLTNSSWIYSSSYDQWGQEVEESYQWLNDLLRPVKGAQIIGRETLADGVVATSYSNGQQIIVNYSNAPYIDGELFVDAQNATIREVSE
jgi:hypothetical protein